MPQMAAWSTGPDVARAQPAEGGVEADQGADPVPAHGKDGRRPAGGEVPGNGPQRGDERQGPAPRDELTEGHEVALVVQLRGPAFGCVEEGRVEEPPPWRAGVAPGQEVGVVLAGRVGEGPVQRRVEARIVVEARLGKDDEIDRPADAF